MAVEKPMTVREVAEQCHVSKVSVLRWIRQGELVSHTTPGGHHRIRREDFEAFARRYRMPVDERALADRSGGSAPGAPTAPAPAIIVADDDPMIRELSERILARELPDHRVELAADGYEAFYLIGKVTPRLVILDIRMPHMNGLEVCRKMRSHESLREIPILVVTAFSREFPHDKILEAGADVVLEKPFDIVEFSSAVHRLLAKEKKAVPS